MGLKSRRKGQRFEYEVVYWLHTLGLDARRVPLSGAVGGEYAGDVRITWGGRTILAECKRIRKFPKILRDAIQNAGVAFLREDRGDIVVVIKKSFLDEMIKSIKEEAERE